MSAFDTLTHILYLLAASSFVLGLHLMTSPATARRGNLLSAAGMALAIATTIAVLAHAPRDHGHRPPIVLTVGLVGGGLAGLLTARRVKMTAMPQLVSLFNAVGGGAAALIAFGDAIRHAGSLQPWSTARQYHPDHGPGLAHRRHHLLRLADRRRQARRHHRRQAHRPSPPAGRSTLILAVVALAGGATYTAGHGGVPILCALTVAALGLGVLVTLPIGGADMPVVISLLNACTGTAVAMAGFVIDSTPLIIAGALVGAAGAHPHQADGRRDEPLAAQHHRRRFRHRRQQHRGQPTCANRHSARGHRR